MTNDLPIIFCSACGSQITVKVNISTDPYNPDRSYTLSCDTCKDVPQLTEKNVDDLTQFFMKELISDLLIPFDPVIIDKDDSVVNFGG